MKKKVNLKAQLLIAILALGMNACKKNETGSAPQPVQAEKVNLNITELKAKSTAASVTLGESGKLFKVKGIVISDKDARNIDSKTAVITQEDNAAGIIVNFNAAHNLALGSEVEIGVSNQKLLQQNGEIILDAIPPDSAKITATGKTITARTATISEIVNNKAAWNGTLVTIGEGMFSGSGQYKGTLTYSLGNESIKSAILPGASFENSDYPGLAKGLTGIVRITGNETLLNIRNVSDVRKTETFVYVEDFAGAAPGIYTGMETIATGQSVFDNIIATAFTKKYGPNTSSWIGGSAWVRNYAMGINAINVIKTISSGSSDPDASFVIPNKTYYCVLPYALNALFPQLSDPGSRFYGQEFSYFSSSLNLSRYGNSDDLKNLKSLTIVCAGSKMKLKDFDPQSIFTKNAEYNEFDAAKDGFNVNLYTNEREKIEASSVYKSQGIWQTIKFDNIYNKLVELDKSGSGNRRDLRLTFGSAVNGRGSADIAQNGDLSAIFGSPIIIDKIILEFSEKPVWDK